MYEADHLPRTAEVKNVWSHVSTPSTICMARKSVNHTDIITFRFLQIQSSVEVASTPNIALNHIFFLNYIPAVLSNLEEVWFPFLALFCLLVIVCLAQRP